MNFIRNQYHARKCYLHPSFIYRQKRPNGISDSAVAAQVHGCVRLSLAQFSLGTKYMLRNS